jgi:putative Ca2+/H+ antiporter (TMEM165/GDT1 family)
LAAELESPQIADAYRRGLYPPASWVAETRTRTIARLIALRKLLLNYFLLAVVSAAVIAGVAAVLGKVHPALPPDYGKITSAVGATIAAWAAFLQLSPVERTFRESFLHETTYAAAVKVLAVLGVFLAGLGGLWWQ